VENAQRRLRPDTINRYGARPRPLLCSCSASSGHKTSWPLAALAWASDSLENMVVMLASPIAEGSSYAAAIFDLVGSLTGGLSLLASAFWLPGRRG
jgi:hypothetical protein